MVCGSIGIDWAHSSTMHHLKPGNVLISRTPVRFVHFCQTRHGGFKGGHPGRRPRIVHQMGSILPPTPDPIPSWLQIGPVWDPGRPGNQRKGHAMWGQGLHKPMQCQGNAGPTQAKSNAQQWQCKPMPMRSKCKCKSGHVRSAAAAVALKLLLWCFLL